MTTSEVTAFYPETAERIELSFREVNSEFVYDEKVFVAVLESFSPGVESVVIYLGEDEARALAAAIIGGFNEYERSKACQTPLGGPVTSSGSAAEPSSSADPTT